MLLGPDLPQQAVPHQIQREGKEPNSTMKPLLESAKFVVIPTVTDKGNPSEEGAGRSGTSAAIHYANLLRSSLSLPSAY